MVTSGSMNRPKDMQKIHKWMPLPSDSDLIEEEEDLRTERHKLFRALYNQTLN